MLLHELVRMVVFLSRLDVIDEGEVGGFRNRTNLGLHFGEVHDSCLNWFAC